ncbi:MAG: tetratricopeptide repeat protein [Pseudomonadota bacterium]
MLARPTDTDAAFRFAEIAVEDGDLFGAIAALERILRLDPDRPDIEIRLGELYQRVGAVALARAYLEAALDSPAVPPEIRERAQDLLDQSAAATIARGQRHSFTGRVSLGPRYETNANAGPDSVLVRANGQSALISPEGRKQGDFSLALTADLRHRYLLDSQRRHRLETNFQGFFSRYSDVKTSNTTFGALETGPRFVLGEAGLTSIRPFLEATYLGLNDATYRAEYGGGVNLRHLLRPDVLVEGTLRYVAQDFRDTDDQPSGSLRTGQDLTFRPGFTWGVLPNFLVSADALVGHKNAEVSFESFTDLGAGISATYVFDFAPIADWSVTGNALYRRSQYSGVDPFVDPNVKRRDDRFDVGLTLNVPITADVGISAGARYADNDSNLPNFTFSNTTVSVLATYAF